MPSRWRISVGKSTFRRLSDELRNYFAKRLRDDADPTDLVSAVWLSGGRYYRKRTSLRHYLYSVARSVLGEHNRIQARRGERVPVEEDALLRDLPDERPGPETVELWRSGAEFVRGCVPQISEVHREVVRLFLDGLDAMQIAEQLGLPYNTVRSRLSRGRRQLERVVRFRLAFPAQSG